MAVPPFPQGNISNSDWANIVSIYASNDPTRIANLERYLGALGGAGYNPTGTPPPAPTQQPQQQQQQQAVNQTNNATVIATLRSWLASVGLSDLMGFVEQKVLEGYTTAESLRAAVEATDAWRARFPLIAAQRQAAATGQPVAPWTPAQVLETENRLRSLFRYYSIPAGMYDTPQELQQLMERIGGEPDQVTSLIEQQALRSWERVAQAPQEVRSWLAEQYGPQGLDMLAAFYLDPENMTMNLPRITSAAVAGGYARTHGFDLGRSRAFELADLGYDDPARLSQGFSQIAQQAPLFAETVTETTDMQAGEEGIKAAFDLPGGGQATAALQQRARTRAAAFGGGGTGAVTSGQGLVGLGSVE